MPDFSCYLIGDSISLDYGPHLEYALLGACSYSRKDGMDDAMLNLDNPTGANGGDSSMVREFFAAKAAKPSQTYDLTCINCGLHDIKKPYETGALVIDIDDYRDNLHAILTSALAFSTKVCWIRTTPIDDARHAARKAKFDRFQKDINAYNAVADEVMSERNITVLDLAGFTAGLEGDVYRDGVHFTNEVKQLQGYWLAGWICGMLANS